MVIKLKFLLFFILLASCSSSEKKAELAQIHLKTGTSYLLKGNASQALSTLQEAEKLNPEDATIQNNLGLAFFLKKDYEKAETHLKKAILLKSPYSDAQNNLGRVYVELSRFDDAIKTLTPVVGDVSYPYIEKAYINLGLAYMKKGDLNTALVQFSRSIAANNTFCPSHNYYGQALFKLQKFEEAAESFETALKLCNNSYDEAHYYSGLSYYKIGEREKALARLEEVVKLYPDTEFAIKAKSMLKIMR